MLRRSDLADDGIIDQGPGKWAAHCHLFSGIPLLSPFIQFPCVNIWQEKKRKCDLMGLCFLFGIVRVRLLYKQTQTTIREKLHQTTISGRLHRASNSHQANPIPRQISTKTTQFSKCKFASLAFVGQWACRQHCAQLSDAGWTPDRERGELEQRFLMILQSVCSWSSNALTLNHIAFKLCCSVISKSCQDGITTQQQSMSHPRYLVNNDNLYSGQWTGMATMVGSCCHTRFMTCMYYPSIPGAGGELNFARLANAVQSHS